MDRKSVVIDLCSDSEADSSDDYYKIEPSPEAKRVKTLSKPTPTATTNADALATSTKTKTTKTKKTTWATGTTATLVTTKTTFSPPAPIFARHAEPPKKRAKTKAKATDDMLVAPGRKVQAETAERGDGFGHFALLATLNAAQRRAVTSTANTVAILAGPGSGKTHTLTSRVAWLIDQVGHAPSNVIVATFTVKAAREMKERIGKVLGGGREKRVVLGTFHSVALRYLSAYGTRIGVAKGFSIVDDHDSKSIIKRIVKRLDVQLDTAMARGWISKKKSKGCLGGDADDEAAKTKKMKIQKNGSQQANGAMGSAGGKDVAAVLQTVYDEYQKHLQSLNLLDYDDLLIRCTQLLRAHPACVANVQAVLIDEYQDTNGIQFELMKLLAQACHRITVVGDPDQSIYGWRSAETTNLARFLSDFPHTAEIALEENYRSSQCILSTSLQVIQQDPARYDKSLLPVHKKGTLPVLRRLQGAMHEAQWILQETRRATLLTGHMLNHDDVAILVRSAALSRPIEQALARAGVPYRMMGGRKFFERAEVKLLVDYLRVVHQPHNNDVLARIINVPRRGVGPKTIQGCLEEAEAGSISLWTLITKHCRGDLVAKTGITAPTEKKIGRFIDLIQRMQCRLRGTVDEAEGAEEGRDGKEANEGKAGGAVTGVAGTISDAFTTTEPAKAYDLVQLIVALTEQLDYRTYIGETYGGDDEARWANVDEFVTLAREFMNNAQLLMAEDELPTVDGVEQTKETDVLNKFLANISLAADADKTQDGTGSSVPMVTISTIHAAKGLEWPVVFIPAAYEGSLPHSRSEDIDEERRLLYVAMTRAKCLLNISYPLFGAPDRDKEREARRSEQNLSPFLADIVDVWFAERGPTYDRALLEEMGDILGRPVPNERAIYQDLPTNVPLLDDVFPLDPLEASRYHNEDEDGGYEYSSRLRRRQQQQQQQGGPIYAGYNENSQNSKRRRTMTEMPNYSGGDQGSWQRGYTTTMEGGGSNFTMGGGAAYPGFTTASAHQAAMLEAEAAEAAKRRPLPGPSTSTSTTTDKRKRGALPTGQQTIMQSFTRSHSTGTAETTTTATTATTTTPARPQTTAPVKAGFQRSSSMFAMQQQHQHQYHQQGPGPAVPVGIPPALKNRSLGGVRGNMLPAAGLCGPDAMGQLGGNDKDKNTDKEQGREKRYAHFSSSPRRETEPTLDDGQPPAAVPPVTIAPPPQRPQRPQPYGYNHPRPYRASQRPVVDKENHQLGAVAGKGGDRTRPTTRPATSFHTTTFAQVQENGIGRDGGGGRGGSALAPMDRLRQPFKPPTIRRPQ